MLLISKELASQLPALGSTADDPDPMIQCKFFYPDFHWTWYAIEYDGQDVCYGFVDGDFPELGTFSLVELQANRGKLGMPVERDRYFQPCRLSELRTRLDR
jgi:hypothetical protein